MKITIGTRGSALALTQTEYVKSQLEKAYPMHTYEIKIIRTYGRNFWSSFKVQLCAGSVFRN